MNDIFWDDEKVYDAIRDVLKNCVGLIPMVDLRKSIYDFKQSKFKQPLFTTEDGVSIYEGDDVEIVNGVWAQWAKYSITKESYEEYKTHCKFFSTEQAANNYVLMNNPCLSVNDVMNRCGFLVDDIKLFNSELKKLAQQKINIK